MRHGQEDEYVVILPDGPAWIEANGAVQDVAGNSIVFVPPGESRVILPEGGTIVRLFTAKAADLLALCPNRAAYDAGRSHIPPFATWPAPRAATRSAPIVLMSRRKRAVSAASSAARPSW
ncbi:hypothetical protein QWZ10_04115 [Paracoccus cavernae]|uniref:Uncharacterized protein n=1 Tax=Paracoccus cavernae TaxID=1571207 RepID=A0ABT8D5N6_9RHOB|nr:hypothetical protein [Paracoccus cavernae]